MVLQVYKHWVFSINHIKFSLYYLFNEFLKYSWGRHDRDRMVVGFTITYAISAYQGGRYVRLK
jgi:hypothetical protein